MTRYTVHFRNDVAWDSHDIEADTPENALALARRHVDDDSLDLWFEPFDLTSDINEIVIRDDDGNELAIWYDDNLRLHLAARDMLEALELVAAGNTEIGRLEAIAKAAIAKAKGGAS